MLCQTEPLLEPPKLAERITAERAIDFDRDERVARFEHPLAYGIQRSRVREEQHLERIGVGAESLSNRLSSRPIRRAAIGAHEIVGRRNQALRPGEREGEDAAAILIRWLVRD